MCTFAWWSDAFSHQSLVTVSLKIKMFDCGLESPNPVHCSTVKCKQSSDQPIFFLLRSDFLLLWQTSDKHCMVYKTCLDIEKKFSLCIPGFQTMNSNTLPRWVIWNQAPSCSRAPATFAVYSAVPFFFLFSNDCMSIQSKLSCYGLLRPAKFWAHIPVFFLRVPLPCLLLLVLVGCFHPLLTPHEGKTWLKRTYIWMFKITHSKERACTNWFF